MTLPNGTASGRQSEKDRAAYSLTEDAFATSSISLIDKLEAFPRFSTKRSVARFLAKHELFKQIVDVNGIIVECGVFNGAGLFTWAQLSNIYEPVNYTRKIVGFDTFEGFPSVHENDNVGDQGNKIGDLRGSKLGELGVSVSKYDGERSLSHISKIELVQGDFNVTAARYVEENPQTIVSLMYLDFDLYEPTKTALEVFVPRMSKGSIIAFDELNCETFPGETTAFDEVIGIGKYAIKRFPIDPWISYVVL